MPVPWQGFLCPFHGYIVQNLHKKKTLIALATLGVFTGVACAASSVTLYGKVDMSAVVSKADGQDTTVQMKSGYNEGSRWGIKGVEELGNGYSVGFQLEQGFNADNGSEATSGLAFSREAQLNVNGGFGTLAFGRIAALGSGTGSFSPLYGWALSTNFGFGSWNAGGWYNTVRNNNTIMYRTPSLGGFQAYLEYSNGSVDDAKQFADNQHYYGVAAAYVGGPIRTSLIFECWDGKGKGFTPSNQAVGLSDPYYSVNFGFEYNLGPITPMFAYRFITSDNYMDMHTFGLSAKAPVGGFITYFGVRYAFADAKGTAKETWKARFDEDKGNSLNISAAFDYPLSKRTKLWGIAGWSNGDKAFKAKNVSLINSYQLKSDNAIYLDGYAIGIGITHNF